MRHLFLARPRSQRLLVAAGLLAIGVIWLDAAGSRVAAAWSEASGTRAERGMQSEWLARAAAIEAESAKAKEGLGSGKGYDAARLVAEAADLLAQAGLTANTDPPRTQRSGPFALHSVQLTLRRTDLPSLLRLYALVKPRAPYLAVGAVQIQADRSGNGAVSARIQLTAVELAR